MRSFRRYKIKYDCNCTQQKSHNLFKAVKNSIEQCFAAHIFQCCQQYCSAFIIVTPERRLIQAEQC